VQRHDILTARVEETAAETYLYLDGGFIPQIELIDLRESSFDVDTRMLDKEAEQIANDLVWRPFEFDLESGRSGPLMRAFLVIAWDDRSVFGIIVHHTIADFLSMAIIGRDLSRFYDAYVNGKIPHRSAPTLSFIDHLISFDTWLASPAGKVALAHWRAKLAADSPPIMIPPDAVASGCSGVVRFRFPASLSQAMRELARTRRIRFLVVCLAAQLLALMQVSGKKEGLVYINHMGRDQTQLFNVVGRFSGPIPIYVSLHCAHSLVDVLSQVTRDCEDLFNTTPVPLYKLGLSDAKNGPGFNFVDCSADINGRLFSAPLDIPWPESKTQPNMGFYHWLLVERTTEGLSGAMLHANYAESTAREFIMDMLTLFTLAIESPNRRLDDLFACCKAPKSRRSPDGVFR
jgi:hypothetical protein